MPPRIRSVGIILLLAAFISLGIPFLVTHLSLIAPTTPRAYQIHVIRDSRQPDVTEIHIAVSENTPLFHSLNEQKVSCDGLRFNRSSEPGPYIHTFSGEIAAKGDGQTYQCVFSDWTGATSIAIPAHGAHVFAQFNSPTSYASVLKNQDLTISFSLLAAAHILNIDARDEQGNIAHISSWSLGPHGGQGLFLSGQLGNLQAGAGEIVLDSPMTTYHTDAAWKNSAITYHDIIALPVAWVAA